MIVPGEVTIDLLIETMEKAPKRVYLIDGFPRNVENYLKWDFVTPNQKFMIQPSQNNFIDL